MQVGWAPSLSKCMVAGTPSSLAMAGVCEERREMAVKETKA